MDNVTLIAMTEALENIKTRKFRSLEDKLKAAMEITHNHWLQTDKEQQLLAAINATLQICDEKERTILRDNIEEMRAISSLFLGVPVNMDDVVKPQKRIPILKLWDEVNEA